MTAPSKFRNLSIYMVSSVLQVAVSLVLVPIYTRLIAPDEYGVFDMLQIVLVVGIGLGNWGLLSAFERFFFAYAADHDRQKRLLATLYTFSFICLGLGFVAATVLSPTLAARLTGDARWAPLLVMLYAGGGLAYLNNFFFSYFRNTESAGAFAALEIGRLAVGTALSLVLIAGFGCGIWGLVVGQLVAQGAVTLVCLVRFAPVIFRFRLDLALLREGLAYGWPLMSKIVVSVFNTTVDKFLIGVFISLTVLGVYGRAQGVAMAVFMFMATVQNVYAPRWNQALFATTDPADRTVAGLFTEYVCIVLPPAVLLVAFCREILGILMPEPYHGVMPLVVWLIVYYALLAFGKLNGYVLAYLKMTRLNGAVALVTAVLTVGLNILLIPRYGPMGAVVVTLSVGLGSTIFTMIATAPRRPVHYQVLNLTLLYGGLVILAVASYVSVIDKLPYAVGLVVRLILFLAWAGAWLKVVGIDRLRALVNQALQTVRGLRRPRVETAG